MDDISKEMFDKLERSKELTVDELIKKLQQYKEKYNGGTHTVNIQAYWCENALFGLTAYDVDCEDGSCEIYCEDNSRVYGPLLRDIVNGGPLEEWYKKNKNCEWFDMTIDGKQRFVH